MSNATIIITTKKFIFIFIDNGKEIFVREFNSHLATLLINFESSEWLRLLRH